MRRRCQSYSGSSSPNLVLSKAIGLPQAVAVPAHAGLHFTIFAHDVGEFLQQVQYVFGQSSHAGLSNGWVGLESAVSHKDEGMKARRVPGRV